MRFSSLCIIFLLLINCSLSKKSEEGSISLASDDLVLKIQNQVRSAPNLFKFPYDSSKYKINKDKFNIKEIRLTIPDQGKRKGKFKGITYFRTENSLGSNGRGVITVNRGMVNEKIHDNKIKIEIESSIGYFLNQEAFKSRKFANYEVNRKDGKFRLTNLDFKSEILKNLFWENNAYSKSFTKLLKRDSIALRDQFSSEIIGIQSYSLPFYPDLPITENSPWEKQVYLENEFPLEHTFNSRLYSFIPLGFVEGSPNKIFIEYIYEDYRMRGVSRNEEDIDQIPFDLKTNAKTLTKANFNETKHYLDGLRLSGLFAVQAIGQQSSKGAGFIIYDLQNQKILEWQEGSLSLEITVVENPNATSGKSINYNANKAQFIYLDDDFRNLDYSDFNACESQPLKCQYNF